MRNNEHKVTLNSSSLNLMNIKINLNIFYNASSKKSQMKLRTLNGVDKTSPRKCLRFKYHISTVNVIRRTTQRFRRNNLLFFFLQIIFIRYSNKHLTRNIWLLKNVYFGFYEFIFSDWLLTESEIRIWVIILLFIRVEYICWNNK